MSYFKPRALTVIACGLALTALGADEPKQPDTNFDNLKLLVEGVKKANKVVLYEGLPHQFFDKDLLEQELKNKKTVKVHDYPFYAETLALKDEDAKRLTELFCAADSFAKFRGPKRCGGFHPDYCVEWQDGKGVYHVLVCFGCHEVKCYGPKVDLYCDINNDAYKEFEKVLKPYRKNRPEKKGAPE